MVAEEQHGEHYIKFVGDGDSDSRAEQYNIDMKIFYLYRYWYQTKIVYQQTGVP